MIVAAHMLAFGVSEYIIHSIPSLLPHVDRLYVGHSKRAFAYNPHSRNTLSNCTSIELLRSLNHGGKLFIIEGDWMREEEARNACLERAKADGCDWFLTVDADELYDEPEWAALKKWLFKNSTAEHISTTWYNFYRSTQYVVISPQGSIKSANAGFALRCQPELRFVQQRSTNAQTTRTLDYPCYHYGYVMTNDMMAKKIRSWSHAAEFNASRWFRCKWLNWCEDTKNLHPVSPRAWKRAIRFPLRQPLFSSCFESIETTAIPHPRPVWEDRWFDVSAAALDLLRSFGRELRETLCKGP